MVQLKRKKKILDAQEGGGPWRGEEGGKLWVRNWTFFNSYRWSVLTVIDHVWM